MTNEDPVIKDDSSDAKNKAPLAISDAFPISPIGCNSRNHSLRSVSSVRALIKLVSITPFKSEEQ